MIDMILFSLVLLLVHLLLPSVIALAGEGLESLSVFVAEVLENSVWQLHNMGVCIMNGSIFYIGHDLPPVRAIELGCFVGHCIQGDNHQLTV